MDAKKVASEILNKSRTEGKCSQQRYMYDSLTSDSSRYI